MQMIGKAKRVWIFVNEGDLVAHKPAHLAIMDMLVREGASGATVFRALEGFGGKGEVHTTRIADIAWHLPMLILWIDGEEIVDRLLPALKEMVRRGLITVDETQVALFNPRAVRDLSKLKKAQDIMVRDLVTVTPRTLLPDVVAAMLLKSHRSVPVVDRGVLAGIITNSDLVQRGGLGVRLELLAGLGPADRDAAMGTVAAGSKTAADVMTTALSTVPPQTALASVAEMMAYRRLKRLPVVDAKGALLGMVSRIDLLRTIATGPRPIQAEEVAVGISAGAAVSGVMRRVFPTVYPEAGLGEVFQAVISTRLNRALVIDHEGRVLGLITDGEALERVTPALRPSVLRSVMNRLPFLHHSASDDVRAQHATARTAADLMDRDVPRASPSTPLSDVIGLMLDGAHKLVAVVDAEERLVGIVDRADILRGLVGKP